MKFKINLITMFLLGALCASMASVGIYAMEAQVVEEEVVTLTSQDNEEFPLSVGIAELAGTIKGVIEDVGIADPIPLSTISAKTLSKIIDLLNALDPLVTENKKAKEVAKIYIPRAYQLKVNDSVGNLNEMQLGDLLRAANYLDAPFILNALAAVIADKISDKVSLKKQVEGEYVMKTLDEQVTIIKEVLGEKFGIIPKGPDSYILKHVTFRECGIKQE